MIPNPYRHAYETALAELTVIADKVEQLRARKNSVENLIKVLQPIVAGSMQTAPEANVDTLHTESMTQQISQEIAMETPESASEPADPSSYSFLQVPNPLPENSDGDPFQHRAKATFRFRGLAAQRSF